VLLTKFSAVVRIPCLRISSKSKKKKTKQKDYNTNNQYGNNKSTSPKDAFELYTICCADQSQQSHIHIGTDIQSFGVIRTNYQSSLWTHQLVATDSVQEETRQVQAPCWKKKLSPSRRTAAPSPVCHIHICIVFIPPFFFSFFLFSNPQNYPFKLPSPLHLWVFLRQE